MTHNPNLNQLGGPGAGGAGWGELVGFMALTIETLKGSWLQTYLDSGAHTWLKPCLSLHCLVLLVFSESLCPHEDFWHGSKRHPPRWLTQKSQEGRWVVQLRETWGPWANRMSPGDSVLPGYPSLACLPPNHPGWTRFLWNNENGDSLKKKRKGGTYKIDMTQKAKKN